MSRTIRNESDPRSAVLVISHELMDESSRMSRLWSKVAQPTGHKTRQDKGEQKKRKILSYRSPCDHDTSPVGIYEPIGICYYSTCIDKARETSCLTRAIALASESPESKHWLSSLSSLLLLSKAPLLYEEAGMIACTKCLAARWRECSMHLYRKLEWKYVNVQALTTCHVCVPPTQP